MLIFIASLLVLSLAAYFAGAARARGLATSNTQFHSTPGYHGLYTASLAGLAMAAAGLVGLGLVHFGLPSFGSVLIPGVIAAIAATLFARNRIAQAFRARNAFERIVYVVLLGCSMVAILTTAGIIFSVAFETLRFFARISPLDFLFGLQWSPQIAMRSDQVIRCLWPHSASVGHTSHHHHRHVGRHPAWHFLGDLYGRICFPSPARHAEAAA